MHNSGRQSVSLSSGQKRRIWVFGLSALEVKCDCTDCDGAAVLFTRVNYQFGTSPSTKVAANILY